MLFRSNTVRTLDRDSKSIILQNVGNTNILIPEGQYIYEMKNRKNNIRVKMTREDRNIIDYLREIAEILEPTAIKIGEWNIKLLGKNGEKIEIIRDLENTQRKMNSNSISWIYRKLPIMSINEKKIEEDEEKPDPDNFRDEKIGRAHV